MDLALGLIETKGLVGAIEAADAMVKAADVKIISKEQVTGALIIVKVIGETAAVKSAVDAGSVSAQRVGQLISSHVIPRPDDQIDFILYEDGPKKSKKAKSPDFQTKRKNIVPKATVSKEEKIEVKSEPKVASSKTKQVVSKDKKEETAPKQKLTEKEAVKVKKVSSSAKIPHMDELVILNVHSLRRIARGIEEFPIKGREISKANRGKLLDYFKSLQ